MFRKDRFYYSIARIYPAKWRVKIKSTSFGNEIKTVNLEIDADTGKILSYEKT